MQSPALRLPSPASSPRRLAEALLMVAAATLLGLLVAPTWGNSAVDLLYLPPVVAAAILGGRAPSLVAALASVLAYNFFFTAPLYTFRINDPSDFATVVVLFGVAIVTSQLAASVRRQATLAEALASRNATIAGLARRLLTCTDTGEVFAATGSELAKIFACNVVLVEPGGAQPVAATPPGLTLTPSDIATAALVLDTGGRAGRGVDRALPVEWQFHAIRSGVAVLAAVGFARDDGAPAVHPDLFPLLDSLLDQVALALERGQLEGEAREFTRVRERDRVRSALLSSIGEDLRPPLAALSEAARRLRRSGTGDKATVAIIDQEAARLDRYLVNLGQLGVDDEQRPVELGPVTIDLFRRTVERDGAAVRLTPKEYAVLAELAKHPGRVLAHAHLLRAVRGPAQEHQTEYLRVAVRGLRQKLEPDPAHPALIINEPAVGYRLAVPERARPG